MWRNSFNVQLGTNAEKRYKCSLIGYLLNSVRSRWNKSQVAIYSRLFVRRPAIYAMHCCVKFYFVILLPFLSNKAQG